MNMEKCFREYFNNYNRVVIVSDYESENESDFIFNLINELFSSRKNHYLMSPEPEPEFRVFDEFNCNPMINNTNTAIRKVVNDTNKSLDSYLIRKIYSVKMVGGIASATGFIPTIVYHNAELVFIIKDKTIHMCKNRYGNDNDLDNILTHIRTFKLRKILNRLKN